MRAADRLVIPEHVSPVVRGVTLAIALGFAFASIHLACSDGGYLLGRVLGGLFALLLLAVFVVVALGTRTVVFARAAGTVRTSIRVFGRDLFARVHPLADFTGIRTFESRSSRNGGFHIHLVGPRRRLLVYRSPLAEPARAALASVVRWLGWPVDDNAGLTSRQGRRP